MQGFVKFNKGALRLRLSIQIWLFILVIFNLIIPLIYINRFEAQIVAITFLLSAMLMMTLTGIVGFTRFLGAGHILWFPLLIFLWTRYDQAPPADYYGIWLRTLMLLNAVALLFDVVDIIRYLAGDRKEIVKGL